MDGWMDEWVDRMDVETQTFENTESFASSRSLAVNEPLLTQLMES